MHRRTRGRFMSVVVGAVALGVLGPGGQVAQAAPAGPDYEMPFPCGDTWRGASRYNHSPSAKSIDWNRTNDLGALVTATAPGVVTKVVNLGSRSYGRYIVIDHRNGKSSLYAHLLSQWVTVGQAVDQGFVIGQVGSTGGSTGPHLHFEQRLNGTVQTSYFHRATWVMGSTKASQACGDTPIAGNFDGVGTDNPGVLRRSATPVFVLKRPGRSTLNLTYGRPGDEAVTGDWNGDGLADVGVRRASSKSFLLRSASGATTTISLGAVSDVGVTGDWNGDQKTDVGVWSPATRVFTLRAANGTTRKVTLGSLGDRPVTGDWNGDGLTDVGVWSPSTARFTLRTATRAGAVSSRTVTYGTSTQLPVTGDWNNDGTTDLATWDPATGVLSKRTPVSGSTTFATRTVTWGTPRG